MIRRLAYVSRPRPGLSLVEIPRIVAASRIRNSPAGISGVLLFTGQDFVELLEGPPTSVSRLWSRIGEDDRHHDLVTLFDERALSPWFADWRVGFPSDSTTISQVAAWRERATATWDAASRAEVRAMLAAADAI